MRIYWEAEAYSQQRRMGWGSVRILKKEGKTSVFVGVVKHVVCSGPALQSWAFLVLLVFCIYLKLKNEQKHQVENKSEVYLQLVEPVCLNVYISYESPVKAVSREKD